MTRARDVYWRIRNSLPFWGFPVILLLVVAIVVSLLVAFKGEGGNKVAVRSEARASHYMPRNTSHGRVLDSVPSGQEYPTFTTPAGGQAQQVPGTQQGTVNATASTAALSSGAEVPGGSATFVFKCYGRAHGVGLCMDGVRYRAESGQSYMSIINYYYTGVNLAQVDDGKVIRVKGRDGQVRSLPMREYLYRLAEEPEDYPAEGLKVLYVAARTYTLSCIARGKHRGQGFDICASGNCCQAFNENKDLSACPNNIAAVNATSGQVLTYNGAPITAAYCGSCGGHTDNNEDVWGGTPLPYLRGKPDPYCQRSPRYCSTVEISASQLQQKLAGAGASVGQLKLVDLANRTPGGRVKVARIVGSSGTREISGKALGLLLGFSGTRYEYSFR